MAEFVIVGFKTEYRADKAIDYVEIAPKGEAFERTKSVLRIKDITPPAFPDMENQSHVAMVARWQVIGPAYEAWKSGNEVPSDGTPLAAWAGVTPDQVQFMIRMGIRTIEAVRDMTDTTATRLPWPNARQLPKLAADYLSGRDTADKDRVIADMAERMAAMEEMLAERMDATPEKRGPGRPRKEAEAA
jgi:hypothetical protein